MAYRDPQVARERGRERFLKRTAERLAAGQPRYKDPESARAYERERSRRCTEKRLALGLCPKCGDEPLAPERRLCAPCGRNGASPSGPGTRPPRP